jgi:hypothetical protein
MAINKLQSGIRKLKNPLTVVFTADKMSVPSHYFENTESTAQAFFAYSKDLLTALKGVVPAVRFSLGSFVMLGVEGIEVLTRLLAFAKKQEFYVLLDGPEILSAQDAILTARAPSSVKVR